MNYQVSYSYKSKLVITNLYSVTTDYFASILLIDDTNITYLIPQNMATAINNGLSINYTAAVTKWWEIIPFVNYNYQKFNGEFENTVVDLELNTYNFRIQNNFNLPANLKIDLTYAYNSSFIWRGSLVMDPTSSVNLGVRKDFFKDKLQLRATVTDILNNASDLNYYGNYGGLIIDGVYSFDYSRIGVGLTFKFGNQKVKSVKRKGSALDDELNRMN